MGDCGIAIVITLGIGFLPFLRRLPAATSRRLIIAGAIYVGGAVGLELAGGPIAAKYGQLSLGYMAITSVEEVLEIFGATLAFRAILLHLGEVLGGTFLRLSSSAQDTSTRTV